MPGRGRCCVGLVLVVGSVLGCGGELVLAEGSSSSEGDDGIGTGTSTTVGETDTGEVELCGNGVLDPGEDCEPSDAGCDVCTDDCRADPLPANEWSLVLGQPGVTLESLALATSVGGRLVVGASTADQQAWVFVAASGGELLGSYGPSEHGFDAIVDHALAENSDVALLGRVGETTRVRRLLAEGAFEPAIEWLADPVAPDQVAITSLGFVSLGPDGPAQALDFAGQPMWTRPGPYTFAGNVEDRVVLYGAEMIEFVAADGSEALTWPWGEGVAYSPYESAARVASVPALLLRGKVVRDTINVWSLDLWTGEQHTATVLSGAPFGLEFMPGASALDARSDGWPLLSWYHCAGEGSAMGCLEGTAWGVGAPDDRRAIEAHDCDVVSTTRIGPDGGVFMLSVLPDGTTLLVRRTTP